jgi:hypothetical protein
MVVSLFSVVMLTWFAATRHQTTRDRISPSARKPL